MSECTHPNSFKLSVCPDCGEDLYPPKEPDELSEITRGLGKAHSESKHWDRERQEFRDAFFKKATEELAQDQPVRINVDFETDDIEDALRQSQRQYLRHKVVSVEKNGETIRVTLEEDPAMKPFTYINKTDGNVYKRIISDGSPILDDEDLARENPELYERVTKLERVLIPFEDMPVEDQEALGRYITFPKPQARLQAPRRATQEELDADND